MTVSTLPSGLTQRVSQDVRTIRELFKRIRQDEQFADLSLFKRRSPDTSERQDERRSRDRRPLVWPIQVTPARFDNGVIECVDCPLGEVHVYTQDVTLRGICFLHTEPLQSSYAVITFALTESDQISLLLEVRWTTPGWNQPFVNCGSILMSGGQFAGIVEPATSTG